MFVISIGADDWDCANEAVERLRNNGKEARAVQNLLGKVFVYITATPATAAQKWDWCKGYLQDLLYSVPIEEEKGGGWFGPPHYLSASLLGRQGVI